MQAAPTTSPSCSSASCDAMEHGDVAPATSVRSDELQVEAAVATHTGPRATNADAYLLDEAAGLFAVSDGMGDTPRSSLVARMALDAVREMFLPPWSILPAADRCASEAAERMYLGVAQAHGRLYVPGRGRDQRIGATFAGVVACGGGLLCVGHVGDSRVYLLQRRGGRVWRLTEDHTVVGDARRCGERDHDVSRNADDHALTRMIGATRAAEVEPIVRGWKPGDVVLVCSDGVSDWLDFPAVVDLVLDAGDLGDVAQRLVDGALAAGGCDNATAVLVRRAR
jgi:serine/threonine protein phosphatase PrpC